MTSTTLHAVEKPLPNAAEELRRTARVLSADGGPHAAHRELRDKLCLLDNGDLLILTGARLHHDVLAYIDGLNRHGVQHSQRFVSLTELRDYYSRAQASSGAAAPALNNSNRQQQVLTLIGAATASNASDIHFVVKRDIALVRWRVNGLLETHVDMRASDGGELCATIYQSMCDLAEPTYNPKKSQDGRLKQEYLEAAGLYGARIATRPTDHGTLMVLRLLYNSGERVRTLDQLGYLPEQVALIQRLTKKKNGMNVFSGPTGSGKSTSLQVMFGQVIANYEGKLNALTIEDPVEYTIDGAVQTPVERDAEQRANWEAGIRNAMRLDPDVVMVGEMRDFPSTQVAFQAALTGHGVWTSVHANDAGTILQRIADIGIEAGLYSDPTIVTGLINQNLVPVLCHRCKRPWSARTPEQTPPDVVGRVHQFCDLANVHVRGAGCEACRGTGVSGRTVVAEVIAPNLEFMRTYRERGKAEARRYWIEHMSGITKIQHVTRRINEGTVDPVLAERYVGLLDEDTYA